MRSLSAIVRETLGLDRLASQVDLRELRVELESIRNALAYKPPKRSFVMAYIEGETTFEGKTSRITCGASGHVQERGDLQLRPVTHFAVTHPRVTLFANFEEVEVNGVYLGIMVAHPARGTCPTASFEGSTWDPATVLRIDCQWRGRS